MDRIWQIVSSAPRAAVAPVVIGAAVAVLVLLGPALYVRDREPFNRLMEFLELVLGRSRPANAAVRTAASAADWRGRGTEGVLRDRRFELRVGNSLGLPETFKPRVRAGRTAAPTGCHKLTEWLMARWVHWILTAPAQLVHAVDDEWCRHGGLAESELRAESQGQAVLTEERRGGRPPGDEFKRGRSGAGGDGQGARLHGSGP